MLKQGHWESNVSTLFVRAVVNHLENSSSFAGGKVLKSE